MTKQSSYLTCGNHPGQSPVRRMADTLFNRAYWIKSSLMGYFISMGIRSPLLLPLDFVKIALKYSKQKRHFVFVYDLRGFVVNKFKILNIIFKTCLERFGPVTTRCVGEPERIATTQEREENALNTMEESSMNSYQLKTVRQGDRSFHVCGPRIWKSLSTEVRLAPTVELFKTLLKTYLFSRSS